MLIKNSMYKKIYKKLKVHERPGGRFIADMLDYIIAHKIKPFDFQLTKIEEMISSYEATTIAIDTASTRFMALVRGNNKITKLFSNTTKRLTLKTFMIDLLLLHDKEIK